MTSRNINQQNYTGLIAGLAAMFSITALITMSALIWGLGTIQENLDEVIGTHMEKISLAVEMRNAARARTLTLSNMLLKTDPFEQDEDYLVFNHYGAEFAKARFKLLQMKLDNKETAIIKKQGEYSGNAVPVQNDVIDLIYNEELDDARELLLGISIPLQNKVMDQLTLLHNYQKFATDLAIKRTEQTYQKTRNWILLFSVTAGLIGLVVAAFIMHRNRQNTQLRERYLKEEKESNSKLEIARKTAESASKSKSLFMANMSHELRTPLNAIIGYSELLREEISDNDINLSLRDCDKIKSSGVHLLSLINEVLDLSKIEAGKMVASTEEFLIDDLIDPVALNIEPLTAKNRNVLTISNGTKNCLIKTDFVKLKQILINLLSNANKFTDHGNITFVTETFREHDKTWYSFTVTDTGIGIPSEQLQSIFMPFEQVDSSHTRDHEGTGLGLAITQKFCDLLGGNISISSNLGKGTTCIVHLPEYRAA